MCLDSRQWQQHALHSQLTSMVITSQSSAALRSTRCAKHQHRCREMMVIEPPRSVCLPSRLAMPASSIIRMMLRHGLRKSRTARPERGLELIISCSQPQSASRCMQTYVLWATHFISGVLLDLKQLKGNGCGGPLGLNRQSGRLWWTRGAEWSGCGSEHQLVINQRSIAHHTKLLRKASTLHLTR